MSWIEFFEVEARSKLRTKIWKVATTDGATLGHVRWYSPWRKYVFVPVEGSFYEEDCLADIAKFCETATAKRRRERAIERVNENQVSA